MKAPPQRAAVIANRVRMKRDYHGTSVFMLVEGDDDKKLYKRFVEQVRCRIQVAYGRPNVEEVLATLEKEGFPGILAIIDADFDHLEERARDNPNLLRTDSHDAETMMLASPALDHVLREHGDEDKIEKFCQEAGRSVREHLLDLARLCGALRWISARNKLGLRFEGFPFDRVVHKKTWHLDETKVLPELQGHSRAGVLDRDAIDKLLAMVFEPAPEPWQLCCGHDMVAILAIGLGHAIGSQKPAEVKPDILEKDLRLAYETAYFAATELCRALRDWEKNRVPILVDALRGQSA